ncbi:alpha-galactosidase [Aerococcaceae bacterium zg-ZJ1578]|uniref:alpha-galactosidase n=1 Tax=Aerococcaceae bacterium zg-252 TaxID=2796928 RepID=UPI001A2A9947|nr:alpha-galactosidase [Aerococcaceae bacterium zg-1578]
MIRFCKKTKKFMLSNSKISYIMGIDEQLVLTHEYFGKAIRAVSCLGSMPSMTRNWEVQPIGDLDNLRNYSLGTINQEFPAFGSGDFRQSALKVRYGHGGVNCDLRFDSYEILGKKHQLKTLPCAHSSEQEAETLKIQLVDEAEHLVVKLYYTIYGEQPIITRSVEIINESEYNIEINKCLSASLDFTNATFDLVHLNGAWARERHIIREAVQPGTKRLASNRGITSHNQAAFIAVLGRDTNEFCGAIYGMQLMYSGNHVEIVEQDNYHNIRMQIGIGDDNFNWVLKPGQQFESPEAVLTFSEEGMNGMSQNFHHFIEKNVIPPQFNQKLRPILVNNWEGTYFDFDEAKIIEMMNTACELGVDLFVLDDGWFGKRDSDNVSLGDWTVNREKLPNGLDKIAKHAQECGLMFGIWIEPEMVSVDSELYRNHPEWVLNGYQKALSPSRNQHILDFSRPEVIDYIFNMLQASLGNIPLSYIKWDMNRNLSQVYSHYLSTEQQGEVPHRFVMGMYDLARRIRNECPNILIEGCSGGGGRFDLGILSYAPQIWTSDNTDAVERIKIQYGTSVISPPSTMGAHVSAVPNHQTNRITTLEHRANVAFGGLLGYELDITRLSESEKASIKKQIEFYREYQLVLQFGKFFRLLSPFDSDNEAAWMTINSEKTVAIVSYFVNQIEVAFPLRKLYPVGLCPERLYNIESTDGKQAFEAYGDELMAVGFYVFPQLEADYSSRVFVIKAVEERVMKEI